MATVMVIFTATYTVKSAGGPTYQKGSVRSMAEASARHYINRGVARLANPGDIQAANAITTTAEPPAPPAPPNPAPVAVIDGTPARTLTCDVDLRGIMDEVRRVEGVEAPAAMDAESATDDPDPGLPDNQVDVAAIPGLSSEKIDVQCDPPQPLVTCIMPTWNRGKFVPAAIACWMEQTYQNKELLIIDDGDEPVRKLVPKVPGIRYVRLKEKLTTGAKRNRCCELAKGEIICHFDDDDWSAPDRIADQVARLQETGLPMTGYSTLFLWDRVHNEARRFVGATKGYICGTTMCYLKAFWQDHPFPNKQMSSDNDVVYPAARANQVAFSHNATHVVARIHDCHHTSPKNGVGKAVARSVIPAGFWDNEALITPEAAK
jgi:hypothetical protein